MVYKVGIIGGETHFGEITQLQGKALEIMAAAVRPEQVEWAQETFGCRVFENTENLLACKDLDLIFVANENDRRAEAIVAVLGAGCDVIVDKPLAITMEQQQQQIESILQRNSRRRLFMLLTLRGSPLYAGLRGILQENEIGSPAFTHVRMAVRLKRKQRPPWFLDVRRSGDCCSICLYTVWIRWNG